MEFLQSIAKFVWSFAGSVLSWLIILPGLLASTISWVVASAFHVLQGNVGIMGTLACLLIAISLRRQLLSMFRRQITGVVQLISMISSPGAKAAPGTVSGIRTFEDIRPEGEADRQARRAPLWRYIYGYVRHWGMIGLAIGFGGLLTAASFYTTYNGILSFTSDESKAFVGSYISTVDSKQHTVICKNGAPQQKPGHTAIVSDGADPTDISNIPAETCAAEASGSAVGLAMLISAGIQGILYLASWLLMEEWVAWKGGRNDDEDGGRTGSSIFVIAHFGKVLFFLLPFCASIFFSFDAHFSYVYHEKEREMTRLSVARGGIVTLMNDLRNVVIDQRGSETAKLTDTKEWKAADSSLQGIIKLGESVKGEIEKQQKAMLEELNKELSEASYKNDGLIAQLSELNGQKAVLGTSPAAAASPADGAEQQLVQKRVDQLNVEIQALQSTIGDLRAAMIAEEKTGRVDGSGAQSRAGQGPKWRALNSQLTEKTSKLSSLQSEMKTEEANHAKAVEKDKQRGELRTTLDKKIPDLTAQQQTQAQLMAEITKKIQQLQSANADTGNDPKAPDRSMSAASRLEQAKNLFLQTGSKDSFDKMQFLCATLLENLTSNAVTRDKAAAFSCNFSGVGQYIERLETADRALAAIDKECVVDDTFKDLKTVADFVDKGRRCLSLTKLPGDRLVTYANQIDTIDRENSPDASRFTQTLAAIRRGDWPAWVALALATLVDSLVVGGAYLGARFVTSPELRAGLITKQEYDEAQLGNYAQLVPYVDDPTDIVTRKLLVGACRRDISQSGRPLFILELAKIPSPALQTQIRSFVSMHPSPDIRPVKSGDDMAYYIPQAFFSDQRIRIGRYEKLHAAIHGARKPDAAKLDLGKAWSTNQDRRSGQLWQGGAQFEQDATRRPGTASAGRPFTVVSNEAANTATGSTIETEVPGEPLLKSGRRAVY